MQDTCCLNSNKCPALPFHRRNIKTGGLAMEKRKLIIIGSLMAILIIVIAIFVMTSNKPNEEVDKDGTEI